MTLYCGIDLHANNVVVSIINEDDKIIYEKRLVNNIDEIVFELKPYQEHIYICLRS